MRQRYDSSISAATLSLDADRSHPANSLMFVPSEVGRMTSVSDLYDADTIDR